MPVTLAAQIGTAAYFLICVYAAAQTDRSVKWAAGVIALDEVLYLAAWRREAFFSDRVILFALDAALLAAIVAIGWRRPRAWLVLAGAAQMLCTFGHPVAMLMPIVRERAVSTLMLIGGYLVLACLLWGAVEADLAQRRTRRRSAELDADRAIWRAKGDVEEAISTTLASLPSLRGRDLRISHILLEELVARSARTPYRGDTATRMLHRQRGE